MKKLLILLCLILLTSCNLFWDTHGPYHHSALVYNKEVVDFNGRKFSYTMGEICEFKGDIYEKINYDFVDEGVYKDIKTYSDKLYFSNGNKVYILNADLEIENKLDISAFSFFVDENYMYFTKSSNKYDFYIYDFKNNEINLVASKLRNSTYFINDKLIYVNDFGNIFDVTNDGKLTSVYRQLFYNGVIRDGDFKPSFYANGNSGTIYWNKDKLTITYEENSYEVELSSVNIIYGSIHTENNKIIFATYNYLEHDYCNNDLGCICHFGTTYIWSFDLETKNITKLHTFDEGTYLISFDEINYCYYKDGKVYRNNQEVKEVNMIEPYGEFIQKGDNTYIYASKASITYFYDDGKNVYQIYHDYKDTIKDLY